MDIKEVSGATVYVPSKKKRWNLWATAVVSILGLLAVAIIVMAIVPKSYAISASGLPASSSKSTDDLTYVQIYQGSTTAKATIYKDVDSDLFNEILKTYKASFSQSSLSALFQRELSNKIEYRYLGSSSLSLSNITSSNDYVLSFVYADYQTLYKNGKHYVLDYPNSAYEDGVVKFKTLWVTVNEKDGVNEVNVYVRRISTTGEMSYALLEISTKALQSNLATTLKNAIAEKA